ncbi:hypothetical protein [Undibacterium sp.]|uniref:hypothetical protein n=1 Tax=Undibacterium sp. TaxID=1914977 RepID=UPI00374CFFA3
MTYALKLTPKTVESLRQMSRFIDRSVDVVSSTEPDKCYPGTLKRFLSDGVPSQEIEVKVRLSPTSVALFWSQIPDIKDL